MNKKERKFNYQRLQDAKAVYLTRAGWNEEDDGSWTLNGELIPKQLFDLAVSYQESLDKEILSPKRTISEEDEKNINTQLLTDYIDEVEEPDFNYDTDQMDDGG